MRIEKRLERTARRMAIPVVGAALLILSATAASAATYVVTKTTDTADGFCDQDCSLREAVIAANATTAADEILLPAGFYALTIAGTPGVDDEDASVGDLDLDTQAGGAISIVGDGSDVTTIDSSAIAHRVFHVTVSFNFVPVSITGVTLTGGNWSSGCAISARSRFVTTLTLQDLVVTGCTGSSAIDSWVPLDMRDSTVRDNESSGIALSFDANGGSKTSAIQDTTISGNRGIGISSVRTAQFKQHAFSLLNVTLSGNNRVPSNSSTGAIFTTANATLEHVTITDDGGHGISAIADFYGTPQVTVQNSIVAGNEGGDILGFGEDDGVVLPNSLGNNVIGDAGSGAFNATGDQTNSDPLLAPLADNGGPTATHALGIGSPAIDAAAAAACPDADQRGVGRPIDGDGNGSALCDSGAYEFEPPACSNGLDDDNDGRIDAADRGCSDPGDESERGSDVCDDGIDNDGDELIDYPDDPGCPLPYAFPEDPLCDDGVDNDQNGMTDFDDPKCSRNWPYWEISPCGMGAELALLLPLFAIRRRRRTR